MPSDRTHDVSFTNYHIKDLKTFGKVVQEAANAAFPSGPSRYKEVHVLLLSWEQDDLGVMREIVELHATFEQLYHFDVEEWKIPSERVTKSLRERIGDFLKLNEHEDNLLIVYYGGHAYMNEGRECIWLCNSEEGAPTARWSNLQGNLEDSESDVLILLDCCAAASSSADLGNGTNEIIAACGFETWTPAVGQYSFTRSLIEELISWNKNATLSAALLHNKIVKRMRDWPRFERPTAFEERKTPIHLTISSGKAGRSIALRPLPTKTKPVYELTGDRRIEDSSLGSDVAAQSQSSSSTIVSEPDQSSLRQVWPDEEFEYPRVLLSLRLQEDQWMATDEWIAWLNAVPAIVEYTRVEGRYKSDSTLLLLSMPIAIWDSIPSDPAVIFIAFIRSNNMCEDYYISRSRLQGFNKEPVDSLTLTRLSDSDYRPLKVDPIIARSDSRTGKGPDQNYDQRSLPPWTTRTTVGKHRKLKMLRWFTTKFLIDDSGPMYGDNWETVKQIVQEASPIVAHYDGDGVDVEFFNSYVPLIWRSNLNKNGDIIQLFDEVDPNGDTPTADKLEDVLTEYYDFYKRGNTLKGLNLIVLTDSDLSPGQDVVSVIVKYVKKHAKYFRFGIQFVQIGDNPRATAFLKRLDDELQPMLGRESDMVNTVYWVEEDKARLVEKILLGGILKHTDYYMSEES